MFSNHKAGTTELLAFNFKGALNNPMKAQDVIDFWFEEIDSSQWWKKDSQFDQLIFDRFFTVFEQAKVSALFDWRETPEGRLAEIIVLDQFSRNMFRDKPEALAVDPLGLALSQEAVNLGTLEKLKDNQKPFLIMPYMHSESLKVHDVAMTLFEKIGRPENLEFEKKHRDIIVRFGRYPHRNEVLGRTSTPEELEFLKQPGSSF